MCLLTPIPVKRVIGRGTNGGESSVLENVASFLL